MSCNKMTFARPPLGKGVMQNRTFLRKNRAEIYIKAELELSRPFRSEYKSQISAENRAELYSLPLLHTGRVLHLDFLYDIC